MFLVYSHYNSMADFVTSLRSGMEFYTRAEAEDFVRNYDALHPGRAFHQISEIQVNRPRIFKGGLTPTASDRAEGRACKDCHCWIDHAGAICFCSQRSA
jgi:hypothetical protein